MMKTTTIIKFCCDGCTRDSTRIEPEGYEISPYDEELPKGWRRFAVGFTFMTSAMVRYILCEVCADTIASSLSNLKGGEGVRLARKHGQEGLLARKARRPFCKQARRIFGHIYARADFQSPLPAYLPSGR